MQSSLAKAILIGTNWFKHEKSTIYYTDFGTHIGVLRKLWALSPFTFFSPGAVGVHVLWEHTFLAESDHFYRTKFVWLHAKHIQY